MKVRELLTALANHPEISDLDLSIAVSSEKAVGGEYDGAVQVQTQPLESVVFSYQGLILFIDPDIQKAKADMFVADMERHSQMVLA